MQPPPSSNALPPAPLPDGSSLQLQRAAFQADRTAVALLEAMPGPAMVLNQNREVVLVNQRLVRSMDLTAIDLAGGPLPGQVFGCVHANEPPRGCGSTEACALCGANRAIRECMQTRGQATQECRIVTRQDMATAGTGRSRECHVRRDHG